MKLIKQNTPPWYEARAGKFTASCFDLIMTSPADKHRLLSRTAEKYIRRKARELKYGKPVHEDKDFAAVRWGQKYEEKALTVFQKRIKYKVKCGFLD